MKRFNSSLIWGIVLVVGGVLLLLQSFNLLGTLSNLLWAAVFAAGGLAFLGFLLRNRQTNWWAAIPGFALLGLASVISATGVFKLGGDWGGALFLGALSLGFWAVYLINRPMWWAVIPGGVLLTLALVVILESIPGLDAGSVFFFGIGLTFLALYLLPTDQGRMGWALIPAAAMLVMGVVVAAQNEGILQYLWPVALILVGAFLLLQALRRAKPKE